MSRQVDPQAMVRQYTAKMREFSPVDRSISLSRRDLNSPRYRITRFSEWKDEVNPWRQQSRLPLLDGGLLSDLIYGDLPRIIDDLQVEDDDPAAEYLAGQRSLFALPLYDKGVALNMVVLTRQEAGAFEREHLPEQVWMGNLFGRATQNLVLSLELKQAYEAMDQELQAVAEIQRSLLPATLPEISTMRFARHYQTSRRAGGDYYDFFPLADGKWGILIADVSGHGTPAAVFMAVTHCIAHSHPGPPTPPGKMMAYVNRELSARYTVDNGTFVTAFYGIYDPEARTLTYSSAGHPPPRVKRCQGGDIHSLDAAQNLPWGISADEQFVESEVRFRPGDQIIFYTDGITEAMNRAGEMFGLERLDGVLEDCREDASELIDAVLDALKSFTDNLPAEDDRTMLVAKVS